MFLGMFKFEIFWSLGYEELGDTFTVIVDDLSICCHFELVMYVSDADHILFMHFRSTHKTLI